MVRRAAFDIGSATTKVKVADVDVCRHLEIEVLFAANAPVFFRDDVNDGGRSHFRAETMQRGIEVIRDFRLRAERFAPRGFAAVATSAFREAENGSELARRIEEELSIPVTIIDQNEEAWLGFMGAVRAAGVAPKKAVVWDVGGRSMQMTTLRPDGKLAIYRGDFASGQMRDFVIRQVQQKDRQVLTPNPMNEQDAAAALAYAEALALEEVPREIWAKLGEPETRVVGIGALEYYGDRPASEMGAACALADLELTVNGLLEKSDEEIGGAYASTQISDRLLIVGFMRALGVERVTLADVDLTDGMLFEAQYWQRREAPRSEPIARASEIVHAR